ncbi:MAG: WG repeat-containing protein [Saprospiraceae bacterium]
MKKLHLTFFFLLSFLWSIGQTENVSIALPIEPWKASYPKELPPLEVLNHIDTIRPGLYRSSVGSNFGYFTGEYYQGFFSDTETIIPFEYYFLPRNYSNYMIVKNRKAGVIDSLNNFIIPMIYSSLSPMNPEIPLMENKYLKAWIGKKMGLLDFAGEVIIPIEYKKINEIAPDIFTIENMEEKSGLADLNNSSSYVFTKCKYNDGIRMLNEKFFRVGVKTIKNNRVNRRFGCIDLQGKEIARPIFRKVELSTDGNYIIAFDGQMSKIFDQNGKLVFQKDSVDVRNLVKGIYTFNISRKQFIFRNDFQEIIELENQEMKTMTPDFYLDTKIYKHRSQWLSTRISGVKNYLGKEILPHQFDEIIYINDQLFFAKKKRQPLFAAYNQSGKEITPPSYSQVKKGNENTFVRKPNALKFAMVDQTGKEITPFIYDEIIVKSNFSKRTTEILAKKNSEIIVLNSNGKEIGTKENPKQYSYDFYGERFNKFNLEASQNLKGNRYRHILENDILIQYIFNEDSTGQKIIFTKDKKGNEIKIEIPFFRTVSGTGFSGGKEMLWLFFENKKIKESGSKSILKKLQQQGLLNEMEFYPIKYNSLDKTIFSSKISTSKIDYQKGSLEEKQKLRTLLEIQSRLQNQMVYQPLYEEEAPRVWIDLETLECFFFHLKSTKLRFSKVYFQEGKWFLGSSKSQNSTAENADSFLYFQNINYLNLDQKIVNGTLRLNYKENTKHSYLVF